MGKAGPKRKVEKSVLVHVMGGRTFLQGKTLDGMVANGVKAKAGHH